MSGPLFYVLIGAGVIGCWAAMFWTVRNERERREAERQMEEFKEHLEKLQAAIGEALLPAFAKMATAFAAAGVTAREASEKLRAAAQAAGKLGRKEGDR